MRAPIDEYYTDKEYEYALREMRRMMEMKRIATEASIAINKLSELKTTFDNNAKALAENTKSTISSIQEQIDSAIRGAVSTKLKETIPQKLNQYDTIP